MTEYTHYDWDSRTEMASGHRLPDDYEIPETIPALRKSGALVFDVPTDWYSDWRHGNDRLSQHLPFSVSDDVTIPKEESLMLVFIPDELGSDHGRIDDILPPVVANLYDDGDTQSRYRRLCWSFFQSRDGDRIENEDGAPALDDDGNEQFLEFSGGYGALYVEEDVPGPEEDEDEWEVAIGRLDLTKCHGSPEIRKKTIELILTEANDRLGDPELTIAMLDDLLENHGVETIDNPRTQEPLFVYSNSGDSYAATVVYSYESDEYHVAAWADMLEDWEKRHCYDSELEAS